MRRITYWLAVVLIFIIPWEDSITVEITGIAGKAYGSCCCSILGGNNTIGRTISETPSFSCSRIAILFMEFCERILEHGYR